MKAILLTMCSGIALSTASGAAFAQVATSSTGTTTAPDTATLQDIVVTATKRPERVQDIPIAVDVLSASQLKSAAIVQPSDLKLPGVQFITDNGRSTLSIRGVGSAGNPGFDQAVPIYIDGVYFARGGTARTGFLDVERVEILRGPQPTYLGKNAIGGALSVTSKRPGDTFEADITAFHEFEANEQNIQGGVTVPVTSTLSTRFAASFRDMDGWVHDVVLDTDGPHVREFSGRASALWKPIDRFHLYGKYEYTNFLSYGTARELFDCGSIAPASAATVGPDDDCRLNGKTSAVFLPNFAPNVPGNHAPNSDYGRLRMRGGLIEAGYNADFMTLTATGSYYRVRQVDRLADVGERQFVALGTFDNSTQKSIDVRAVSAGHGRFSWLVGAYADQIDLGLDEVGTVFLVGPGDPRFANPGGGLIETSGRQRERSWSAYGEIGYELLDGLTLKVAGRYSEIRKTLLSYELASQIGVYDSGANQVDVIPGLTVFPPIAIRNDKSRFSKFQPAATLEYRPRPGMLLFASYKKGFKAGGYDLETFFVNPNGNTRFGAESVKSYEAGAKLDIVPGRARLNLTVFRADYDNLQVNIFNGIIGSYTANAATARSQGVEVETQIVPVRGLVLSGALNYLDSKYGSFPLAVCYAGQTAAQGCTGGFQSLSGKERVFSPKWSGSVGAELTLPIRSALEDLEFRSGVNLFYTARYSTDGSLASFAFQHGYAQLDGHVGFDLGKSRYSIQLIGRNLTNVRVYDSYQTVAGSGNQVLSAVARRTRQIALQLSAKF